jgi:hypothetical protein
MKSFILLLAVLSGAASFLLFTVGNPDASNWTSGVCSAAQSLCRHPLPMAYAAAGLAGLWVVLMFISAIRD